MPNPDNKPLNILSPVGTAASGFSEGGPFTCMNCLHRTPHSQDETGELVDSCSHPDVMRDPQLEDRRLPDGTIRVDWDDCCTYVRPPKMNAVALVERHCTTVLNEENKYRSWMDVPLNEKGMAEAQDSAEFLTHQYPDIKRIISSPLARALQTAQVVGDLLGLQVEIDQRLISWHLGILTGEDRNQYQDVLEQFIHNPDQQIPDGESLNQVRQRVGEAMQEILSDAEKHGLVLVVTQSSDMYPMLELIEGKQGEELQTGMVGPGGVIAVSVEGQGYKAEVVHGEEKPAEIGVS